MLTKGDVRAAADDAGGAGGLGGAAIAALVLGSIAGIVLCTGGMWYASRRIIAADPSLAPAAPDGKELTCELSFALTPEGRALIQQSRSTASPPILLEDSHPPFYRSIPALPLPQTLIGVSSSPPQLPPGGFYLSSGSAHPPSYAYGSAAPIFTSAAPMHYSLPYGSTAPLPFASPVQYSSDRLPLPHYGPPVSSRWSPGAPPAAGSQSGSQAGSQSRQLGDICYIFT